MTRTSTTLFWFSLTIFVSLGLYHTSYRVEELGRQLRALNTEIESEQKNLHVLKAEWVYLSNPARIEQAARKHLDLKPTEPQQVSRLDKLSSVLDGREQMAAAALESKKTVREASLSQHHPIANKPKVADEEAGRLNTHLVIQKTASIQPAPEGTLDLPKGDFSLASSSETP